MSTVKACFSEKHPKTEDVRGCCSKPNLQTKSMRAEIKLCIYTYIYIYTYRFRCTDFPPLPPLKFKMFETWCAFGSLAKMHPGFLTCGFHNIGRILGCWMNNQWSFTTLGRGWLTSHDFGKVNDGSGYGTPSKWLIIWFINRGPILTTYPHRPGMISSRKINQHQLPTSRRLLDRGSVPSCVTLSPIKCFGLGGLMFFPPRLGWTFFPCKFWWVFVGRT